MSRLTSEQTMQLMALADGELEGAERVATEALIASNEDARRLHETLSGPSSLAVGEWVASSQIENAIKAGAESIAGAVMDRVEKESPKLASLAEGRSHGLHDLADARARRDARLKAGAMFVAFAAIAAGAFFYLGVDKPGASTTTAPMASAVVAPNPNPSAAQVPMPSPSALATAEPTFNWEDEPAPTAAGPGPEVTVESTSSHDVSVFHVPASIGAALNGPGNASGSVIVWIGDDKPEGK